MRLILTNKRNLSQCWKLEIPSKVQAFAVIIEVSKILSLHSIHKENHQQLKIIRLNPYWSSTRMSEENHCYKPVGQLFYKCLEPSLRHVLSYQRTAIFISLCNLKFNEAIK